jgi:ABC-type branched-subunit amino acid transport system ATPase component
VTVLKTESLAVHFGSMRAVDGVDIEVRRSQVVGLIGPNGAGKTTLFNAVSGATPVTGGKVFLGDRDMTGLRADQRARLGLGRSFQNLGLMMDQTVELNLMAAQQMELHYRPLDPLVRPWRWLRGEREARDRVEVILEDYGLAEHRRELLGDLSFGVARFVELAAAMSSSPQLVLLDEPTTGLDLVETQRLLVALQAARDAGRTILVIAHNVEFVMELCDWIYVLASGRIISEGEPRVVQRDPVVTSAYLGVA